MAEYDVDFLIALIEERPVLWDTSDEHYKNKFIKQDAWNSVCESLFPNFQDKGNSEKTKLGNEVLKRWRGINDTFKKYVKKLEEEKRSGAGAKPTKEYHLYKQLLFLKKNLQNSTTDSINVTEAPPGQENRAISENSPRRYKQRPRKRKANEFQNDILDIFKEPENRHLSFFMGILPSLQRLDENKILIFQSRVLQTLTDLLQPAYQDYPPCSSSYQPRNYQSYTRYETQHFSNKTPPCVKHEQSSNANQTPIPHLSDEQSSNAGEDPINSPSDYSTYSAMSPKEEFDFT